MRQLGHGVLEWTSPEGRIYVDEPEPVGPRFTERYADSYTDWLWKGVIGPEPETPF